MSSESVVILYKDMPDSVIPHTETQTHVSIILHVQTMIAWFLELVIISAVLRERIRDIPRDTQFILSLCVADFLFASTVMLYGFIDLAAGGWGTGQFGCLAIAGMIIFTVAVSIFSLCGLTMYRYLIITHKIFLTGKQTMIAIAGIWIVAATLISSHLYCALTWWGSDNPVSVAAVSFCLIAISFPLAFISYAYTVIVKRYMLRSRAKVLAAIGTSIHNNSVQIEISEQEILLIKKALFISGSYLVCWAPYLVKVFIEIGTKSPVSYPFDVFCAFAGCYNTILNATILLFYDAKTRNAVHDMLGPIRRFLGMGRMSSRSHSLEQLVGRKDKKRLPKLAIGGRNVQNDITTVKSPSPDRPPSPSPFGMGDADQIIPHLRSS